MPATAVPTSRPRVSSAVAAVVLLLAVPGASSSSGVPGAPPSGAPLEYRISFENRAHREARVELRIPDLGPGPLALRMSRTSPGRYALHEFAKNVYDVVITDGEGRPVPVHRPDPHQWTVSGHGGEVRVAYTLYADRADGTYSQIDDSHAHLNVPATFMYAPELLERPVELRVVVPRGSRWEVATQLAPTADPYAFTAPDGHYFMDSPLEIGPLAWRSWDVATEHGVQRIRVAMHHRGTDADLDAYAGWTRAVTEELAAVFGAWPHFDFGTYTFLACYLPWASGDGMEHRNSTVLTSTGTLEESMTGLLGTVAHEFVHAWSIERIRPASLEPFDFEAANMSGELWFGEGFTSYLDDLALVRAGVIDEAAFVERIGAMAGQVELAPGRRFFSPVEMSMQAPFVDAATSVDPTNRVNTFLSYYTWGAGIGLALDLELRGLDPARTLDDLMGAMWRRHGDPERPYTVDDVEAALAEVSGDAAFARRFFDAHVRGRDAPDYAALFARMGVTWGPDPAAPLWITGAALRPVEGGLAVASNTVAGDPLYEAGIDRGDRLVALGPAQGPGPEDVDALLAAASPGDAVDVAVEGRGGRRTVVVTLATRPTRRAALDPAASAVDAARRAEWIASRRSP